VVVVVVIILYSKFGKENKEGIERKISNRQVRKGDQNEMK
jgi:hypothetical protein